MKNNKKIIAVLAVLFATIGLFSFTTDNDPAGHVFVKKIIVGAVDSAQADGYISAEERKQIDSVLASGIVDEVLDAWTQSGYDCSVAVDKAAEVAVREGWFKNKQTAKRYLRRSIEQVRKDGQLFAQLYRVLGI